MYVARENFLLGNPETNSALFNVESATQAVNVAKSKDDHLGARTNLDGGKA